MAVAIREWIEDIREVMARDWREGLLLGGYYTYVGLYLTLSSRLPIGTPVYDREWDLLIVLDACRVDALRTLADEFDFIRTVDSVVSVGSTSGEWMAQTFHRRFTPMIEDTAMVTANAHTEYVLEDRTFPPQWVAAPMTWPRWDPITPDTFTHLEQVWETRWDEELGTVPPRQVTDRAISTARREQNERLIVHYLQPHAPYLGRTEDGDLETTVSKPLTLLRRGEIAREAVWEAYLDTLRLVLSEVALLLENVDAERVVLTADHGEAFGEMGLYEHPVACPHPVVKRVPWAETTASDEGTYDPGPEVSMERSSRDVESKLEALGYM